MDHRILIIFVLFHIGGVFSATAGGDPGTWAWRRSFRPDYGKPKCEVVTTDLCKGLHYNQTRFPNYFDHRNQHEAASEVNQFSALVKAQCSVDLKLFLCTLYVPVCTNYHQPLKPCRNLCRRARKGCVRLIKNHGFKWPENLKCKKFPRRKRDPLCIDRMNSGDKGNEQKSDNKKQGKKDKKKKSEGHNKGLKKVSRTP